MKRKKKAFPDVDEAVHEEFWQDHDGELRCLFYKLSKRVLKRFNKTQINSHCIPIGLPKDMEREKYRADQICALSPWNYKVNNTKIGRHKSKANYNGAGPNLIRKLRTDQEVVNPKSASNHLLDVLGVTTLSVTIGSFTTRTSFVVVSNLGADVLSGHTYIDPHVRAIRPEERIFSTAQSCLLLGVTPGKKSSASPSMLANLSSEEVWLQPRERIASALQMPIPTNDAEINLISREKVESQGLFNPKELAQPFQEIS